MRRLFSTAILFLALIGVLSGQRADTIIDNLAINSAVDPFTSAVVRQIGQSYHVAAAYFSDAPTFTCSVPGGAFVFQASYNGTQWFQPFTEESSSTSLVTGERYTLIQTTGAYSWLRVALFGWDETNCRVTIGYSGTLAPTYVTPLRSGKVSSGSPFVQRADVQIAAIGNTDVIAASIVSNARLTIYGIYLYNQTAQNITIQEAQSGGAFVVIKNLLGFPTGGQLNIPNSGVAQYALNRGSGLRIITSANTVVSGYVLFASE